MPEQNAFALDKEQVNIKIRDKFGPQRLNNASEPPQSFHEQLRKVTKLPQTKEEYRDLKRNHKLLANDLSAIVINEGKHRSPVDSEPEIAPMIEYLLSKNLNRKTVDDQLVNFFRAYDDYKEEKILKLQMKVDRQKAKNKKLRNAQAGAFSDKSEIENEGEKEIYFTTQEGHECSTVFQQARVGMPIFSIGKLGRTHRTVFADQNMDEGWIEHRGTRQRSHFFSKYGVYFMKIKVRRPRPDKKRADLDFARPA